jgi:two-component system, LuxR family, response regulator FixJ
MSFSDQERQTVHVIDDDSTVQQAIAIWLSRAGLTAKAYLSAEQFLATYQPSDVECLLLDMRMPGMSGLDLQDILTAHRVHSPLVIISAIGDTATVVRAMHKGAIEFLEKPIDEQRLLRAVNEALTIDRKAKRQTAELTDRIGQMSPLEREVLALLVAAKTTQEVADALAVGATTVEKHRDRIFEKLSVDNVPALIRLMRRLRQ